MEALEQTRRKDEHHWGGGAKVGRLHGRHHNGTFTEEWPILDQAAYHGLPGKVVEAICPYTEADPVALLSHFLTEFSCVIGRKPEIVIDGAPTPLSLFTVLVGLTSKARKGTAEKRIRLLFQQALPAWTRGKCRGNLSSGEGLVYAVRDPSGEDAGVRDKRIYIVEPEFGSALKLMAREGNSLSGMIRAAWDGDDIAPMTKHNRLKASQPHIAITGHVTEEELKRHLSATEAANGFGNRFLWLLVKRAQFLPFPTAPNKEIMTTLVWSLRDTVSFAKRSHRLKMSRKAKKAWAMVYPTLSEGRPGLKGNLIARAEAQVLRMAALYGLCDKTTTIKDVHLKAALAVQTYVEDSVRWLFGDSIGDPTADRILEALEQAGEQGLSDNEIYEHFCRNQSKKQRTRALELLQRYGRVNVTTRETGGRPAKVWRAMRHVQYRGRGEKFS